MSLAPDLTKTAVISMSSPLDRSASDSPNSSVSDRARDSIISTQRLLPYSSQATPTQAAADLASFSAAGRHRCPPRDVTLPSNADSDALVWSTVTSSGGRVTLPGSGRISSTCLEMISFYNKCIAPWDELRWWEPSLARVLSWPSVALCRMKVKRRR